MGRGELSRVRVVVAGAGLAGLAAARDLEAHGASVTIVEARDRVGGRVHTIRTGFAGGQHAEAGADLIEGEQNFVLELARALGLRPRRILRRGFAFYGPHANGRRRVTSGPPGFHQARRLLKQQTDDFCLAGQRWDSAIAQTLARKSVADWLQEIRARDDQVARMRGLRGFFLADPEDLSLLPVVELFASDETPGKGELFRLPGGNDRLPQMIAKRLGGRLSLQTAVRRIHHSPSGVRVAVEQTGTLDEIDADFCVMALPATTLRDVEFEPALPEEQHRAIATLKYGSATRLLLQFEKPYWRRGTRHRAFGTDLPIGAVWDGNEGQRGRQGILTLLAGGRAARELRELIDREGMQGVVGRLDWLGPPSPLVASRVVAWDDDPWARGGYAYFDPSFAPELRAWLMRPAGRILFAGEHTSIEAQGYMNGAIESGKRAAAEVRALYGRVASGSSARSPHVSGS
jgi:monoamine oxidase